MEKELYKTLTDEGYTNLKEAGECGIIGLHRFIYTTGLVIGLSEYGYAGRYCYESHADAVKALEKWDGTDHPPGDWIKYKGSIGEFSNPNKTD